VLAGIDEGEQVIVFGQQGLKDGSAVEIAAPAEAGGNEPQRSNG
jgi:hypothetical protein